MGTSTASSFDLIGPTALAAAYSRQFSDIPYALEIAQKVDAQTVFEQHTGHHLERLATLVLWIESRYKVINHLIAMFGYTQIIELASGLLPRGMAMSENPNVTFVESDLPAMIDFKKQLVMQLIGERPNLQFEAIDATSLPSQFPIDADYLHDSEKVAILCEGLLLYLTFPEKERVCANVRNMLQRYGGVWITPDLNTKDGWYRLQEINPKIHTTFQGIYNTTGRSLIDNCFNDMEHARQFFIEQGFCVEEYKMIEILGEISDLEPLGIDSDQANHLLATNSVFALTLNS
ncbi:class I SAM-dependent methyltransferase [Scytonema sp. PRP1]|uniref:class I SAM-dependent methyltransferase n=1 Tax=Scytonema sp. PRP1 TaxID=3120513 RepID=UPI002FD748D7